MSDSKSWILWIPFQLQQMIRTAIKNYDRDNNHNIYSTEIQHWATYLYMMCGKATYEVLCKNLPLPQVNTVRKYCFYFAKTNCSNVAEYLTQLNAPLTVWLSEDASAMNAKPSNQLVGMVLPTNPTTGMPVPKSFMPCSASELLQQMNQPKATSVYIVISSCHMARPLMEGVPPFILLLYETDNTFNSIEVQKRWIYIRQELAK